MRFRPKNNILRHEIEIASLLLLFGKPAFGHVQPTGQKTVALSAGVADKDTGLAVIDLAESAAILAGDLGRKNELYKVYSAPIQ